MGCFTDPHFLRVPKSRKSPKRPALPGAVIRVWAVHRPTPFHLLVFHTLSAALIRAFFRWPDLGPLWAFWGWVGYFPRPGEKLRTQGHTGANRGVVWTAAGRKKAAAWFCMAAALVS